MLSISIVDDDPSVLSIFDYMLTQIGHSVTQFSTFQESIRHAKIAPPDLVFQDLMMNAKNIVPHVKSYLKINPNILIVGLLDFRESKSMMSAFEQGLYAVVFKPFDAEEVISIVQHASSSTLSL